MGYEIIRTPKGRIKRAMTRYLQVVSAVDRDWYFVKNANGTMSPSVCGNAEKLVCGYVKTRDWHRGCDWVNVYRRVDD